MRNGNSRYAYSTLKTDRYLRRFYRDWAQTKDLYVAHMVAKETDLEILTNKKLDKNFVMEKINAYRWEIERYIDKDRRFLTSLKPIVVELTAPAIVKAMAAEAKKANVGPMATVAGAIAQFLGEDLLKKGYRDVIIENGGDLFIKATKTRLVGLYAGRSKAWNKLKLKIKPLDTPLGICTSSGTIGHSLSFGNADSVVIISKDACLSDAVATATANRVDSKDDVEQAMVFARSIRGVSGAVIIIKDKLASWGKIEFAR